MGKVKGKVYELLKGKVVGEISDIRGTTVRCGREWGGQLLMREEKQTIGRPDKYNKIYQL